MPLYLPQIYEEDSSRSMTATFLGLNRKLRIADGEFYDMENLTSDHAPVMSVRKQRGIPYLQNAVKPTCITTRARGLAGTYEPVWLDGTTLNIGAETQIDLTPYGFADDGTERQMVNMGAYLIIIPDMIYVNTTKDDDLGVIEDAVTLTAGTVTATVCDYTGESPTYSQASAPTSSLKNGDSWHKTGSEPALKRYDEAAGEWYDITAYLKLVAKDKDGNATPIAMKKQIVAGDSLRLSGAAIETQERLKGIRYIHGVKEYVETDETESKAVMEMWIEGITNTAAGIVVQLSETATVVLERVIPKMDFVCEAGNRLWGCRYGDDGQGNFVNEIYCSARGDFYRWISGASGNDDAPVTFSIGTDGAWTGAVNYDGYPTFFKERFMHRVGGYGASGFSIYDTPCMGVARGAHRSLAVVGTVLYYKSASAVMGFDGSTPVPVSDAVGRLAGYTGAVGAACGAKYYLSLWRATETGTTDRHLYVLDTSKGLWHREDATECESMAPAGDNMYFVAVNREGDTVTHTIMTVEPTEGMTPEEIEDSRIQWYAESGIIGLETPDAKYMTRMAIRLRMDAGASVRLSVQYDSIGPWRHVVGTETSIMKTVTVPVTPARCDHLRIRLDGAGGCQVFSITKTFERAEDL